MIVWSGRGFLSVLVLLVTLFLSALVLPNSLSDYSFVIACFVAAGFSWIFGKAWNTQNGRGVTDAKLGEKFRIRSIHTFFWIPMQYWGIIFSVFGIIILFQNSIVLSIVAFVLLIGLLVFEFVRNIPKSEKSKNVFSNSGFKSAKTKKKELEEEQERLKKLAEEEAERIKRRKEKEDPSRFMPR